MPHDAHDDAAGIPTPGYLPFASSSDVIPFYRGLLQLRIGDEVAEARPGAIELVIRSGSQLLWSVELDDAPLVVRRQWRYRDGRPGTRLLLQFDGSPLELDVHLTGDGRGFFGSASTGGDDEAPLSEVVAHWVDLANLPLGTTLCHEAEDGSWREWGGRSTFVLSGWKVSIDARPGLLPVLAEVTRERLYAVTHTMRLERSGGALFTGREARDLLTAVQVAFSFALGRWTAPVLPVGHNVAGSIAWSEWAPLKVDSPAKAHGRWWVEHRPQDLGEFLRLFVERWQNAGERHSLGFLATSAIAAGESGFVEQRLMTALAALEHLHWKTTDRDDGNADQRIRRLLSAASVPLAVNSDHQPALARFAKGIDGPKALVTIRHSITHPKDTEMIYQEPGLLGEASRLASRYLDLVILHRLGYTGHMVDRTITTGWAGESQLVPWVQSEP